MTDNTLQGTLTVGGFLRDRRTRLAPGPDAPGRRRTPGLRREEVAARAGVSVTWYTWLEQGRGGPPSDDVLERIARALELDSAGREILFLLAQQRPPPLNPAAPPPPVEPALQRVLDALPTSPSIVKTPTWDIVAWNAAAVAVFADFGKLPIAERNVLRRIFLNRDVRATLPGWESDARLTLAIFRIDLARAGERPEAVALVNELQACSADFRRLWSETEVTKYRAGIKHLQHPVAGLLTLEHSIFAVGGAEGLSLIVHTPTSPADVEAIASLVSDRSRTI